MAYSITTWRSKPKLISHQLAALWDELDNAHSLSRRKHDRVSHITRAGAGSKLNAELEFATSQVPMALTGRHHHFCNDIRCAFARLYAGVILLSFCASFLYLWCAC
jgi:hypothetical protein